MCNFCEQKAQNQIQVSLVFNAYFQQTWPCNDFEYQSAFKKKYLNFQSLAVTNLHGYFFKILFLSDTFTCPILGQLVQLFWISGDVSFKARMGSALFTLQRQM